MSDEKHVESVIRVSKEVRFGKQSWDPAETSEEVLEVHRFLTTPAEVGIELGTTREVKRFEFVKLAVSIKVPCYVEQVEAAYDAAYAFASSRLEAELDKCFKPKAKAEPEESVF